MAEYTEGTVLRDKDTGKSIILQGGQWKPHTGAAPAPAAAPGKISEVKPDEPNISVGEDLKRSAGPELLRGTVGLATGIPTLAQMGAKGIGSLAGSWLPQNAADKVQRATKATANFLDPVTYPSAMKWIEDAHGGSLPHPQTTTGQFAGHALQFLPGMLAGGGSLPSRVATGIGSALGSEGAGQAAEAAGFPEWADPARVVGAWKGGSLASVPRRAITRYESDPAHTALMDIAKEKGVNVTAGQYTGNKAQLQTEANLLPHAGQKYQDLPAKQAVEMTRALLGEMGVNGKDASRQAIQAGMRKIDDRITNLKANTSMNFDAPLLAELKDARDAYYQRTGTKPDPANPSPIDQRIQELTQNTPGSVRMGLNGENYYNMRDNLYKQARDLERSDPASATALRQMHAAMDANMERSLAASNSPFAGQWKQAYEQQEAARAINQTVGKGVGGNLDPREVHANVMDPNSSIGRTSHALSRVAEHPGAAPPGPVAGTMSTVLGMLGGHYFHTPGGGTEGGVLGHLAGPPLMEAALRGPHFARPYFSDVGQKYFGNTVFPQAGEFTKMDPKTAAKLLAVQATINQGVKPPEQPEQ